MSFFYFFCIDNQCNWIVWTFSIDGVVEAGWKGEKKSRGTPQLCNYRKRDFKKLRLPHILVHVQTHDGIQVGEVLRLDLEENSGRHS